ncbi:NAD(P)H-binding protein [Sedimenticola sp.]|uniref:NAD(P)H-binding protein n=1 Tax=Sedimenticola sp. TaxID=1940285 RepID=UPI003D0CE0C4
MRILITGATGFIGSHIANAIQKAGHQLTLCVRNPIRAQESFPQATCIPVNFNAGQQVSDWLPHLKNIDVVINAVGIIRETGSQSFNALHRDTPIALFSACEIAGVQRVIQISALGADKSAFSQYHLSKRAADDVLSKLDLHWDILMPSIVYGPRAKSMAFFKAISALPFIPLVDSGDQPVQPIHIGDLVAAVMCCIEERDAANRRIELVGPKLVSQRDLYTRLRRWLGYGAPRFVSLPYSITLRLARWGGFLGDTPINEETVKMLQHGNTGDVTGFTGEFGYLPKSLDQALDEVPAQQSDRWHATLYFIRPWLRWSIAFVWLFTGLISAFVVPTEVSFNMLEKTGIQGIWGLITLYSAAAADILIGIAVLYRYQLRLVGWLQITLILLYTLIITLSQPEQWLHPFGPITKNAPMILSILVMMILEEKQ